MSKRVRPPVSNSNEGEASEVSVRNRQAKTLRERFERHSEAITFAEAGLKDYAQELMRAEKAERAKVLVLGHEDTFSRPVVDYAVGFAERMGYEIIALNAHALRTETPLPEPYCTMFREEFSSKCEKGVDAFRQACEKKGIRFTHVVEFREIDQCIKEVCERMRRVEFVITGPESCPEEGKAAIPVFCMAH